MGIHFILAYLTYLGSWSLIVGMMFVAVSTGIAYIDVPDTQVILPLKPTKEVFTNPNEKGIRVGHDSSRKVVGRHTTDPTKLDISYLNPRVV